MPRRKAQKIPINAVSANHFIRHMKVKQNYEDNTGIKTYGDVSVDIMLMYMQGIYPRCTRRDLRYIVNYITEHYFDFDVVIDSTPKGYRLVITKEQEKKAYQEDMKLAKFYMNKAKLRRHAYYHMINEPIPVDLE